MAGGSNKHRMGFEMSAGRQKEGSLVERKNQETETQAWLQAIVLQNTRKVLSGFRLAYLVHMGEESCRSASCLLPFFMLLLHLVCGLLVKNWQGLRSNDGWVPSPLRGSGALYTCTCSAVRVAYVWFMFYQAECQEFRIEVPFWNVSMVEDSTVI